ncbi:MAG: HAD family hydrolase [Janthinobacterium lividum]
MPAQAHTTPVEAVLFDYGLVLTGPPHPPAWDRMKTLLHAEESAFHAAYWRPRHDYDRGALSGDQYWHAVAADLSQDLDTDTLKALIEADNELWTQPNQPMIDWAAALQAAGVRTGILSNLGDAMEVGVLMRCPWLAAFQHHTFSHRLGIAKPDLAIYRHAAEGLGVDPARVLFIDDREDNIEGARKAGMQAIRYTDQLQFEAAMRDAGLESLLTPATKV